MRSWLMIKQPEEVNKVTVQFEAFIKANQLKQAEQKWLLAVSGGLDSVVLCHLCKAAGIDFGIAHVNFQLRGAESERDENFVRTLAKELLVECLVQRVDTEKYAREEKLSIQEAARELRYQWFFSLTPKPFTHVATAHHADDNLETVLMQVFKGTGIAGLHGILPVRGVLIRPLLGCRKKDLEAFALENNWHWVEDSSNESDKYTRNYFRHQVLPLVEKLVPNAAENVLASIERWKEAEILYHQAIDQHKKKLLEYNGSEVHIPVLKLLKTKPLLSVIYEILIAYGFGGNQVEQVAKLLESETGRFVQSGTHRIIRNRKWLIIAPNNPVEKGIYIVEKGDTSLDFSLGTLHFQEVKFDQKQDIPVSANIAKLNADAIQYPLILRPWKAGDYFYPLGMQKKKKVARFLIDLKVSKTDKEKVWVLESQQRIIWVVGYRIDDRLKITEGKGRALQITLSVSC